MCGIAGIFGMEPSVAARDVVERMSVSLAHRGPDDTGIHEESGYPLIFAHRRLAILDLSRNGHQPMESRDRRFLITYNGEIYNHEALRRELEISTSGASWRSTCDTETLLEAFSAWGMLATLAKVNGMFAFAAFDRLERTLYFARDRFGEKPLYYTRIGAGIAFSSELKALRLLPLPSHAVDTQALSFYLRNSYVPAPRSIFATVSKLPAGSVLQVTRDEHGGLDTKIKEVAAYNVSEPERDEQERGLVRSLHDVLSSSVRSRMLSDVPVGALLSGGVDSTLVVALMQQISTRPVSTFTVSFAEGTYNEGTHAASVAAHLGTRHHELLVSPDDLLRVVEDLPRVWDEPFADPAQVPMLLISRHARETVSVALTGDGGDELFFGYPHYGFGAALYKRASVVPRPLREAASAILTGVVNSPISGLVRDDDTVRKILKLARAFRFGSPADLCDALEEIYPGPELGAAPVHKRSEPVSTRGEQVSIEHLMMDFTLYRYLPENSMTKLDRASMSVGLELRAPFLDPRLVNFARRIRPEVHAKGTAGKWLLRELLYRLVPRELVDRPKAGFSVPIAQWLRGPLRNWAGDLLVQQRAAWRDVLDFAVIDKLWEQHQTAKQNHHRILWNLLMLFQWSR